MSISTPLHLLSGQQRIPRTPFRYWRWCGAYAHGRRLAQVRGVSVLTPPTAPPAAPPPPPRAHAPPAIKNIPASSGEFFGSAFRHAVQEVAASQRIGGPPQPFSPTASSATSSSPSPLSPWLQYLVGLRDDAPGAMRGNAEGQKSTASSLYRSTPSYTSANADTVFLHHVFNNAKEATLYVRVRQPWEFLRPESVQPRHQNHHRAASDATSEWSLIPFGSVLSQLDHVLREMGRRQLAKTKGTQRTPDAPQGEDFLLSFWRAMLEQAFLEQYCEVSALEVVATPQEGSRGSQDAHRPRTVFDLYPYDYREQPADLRRRLDQGVRALLCASAFTLHAQWEQYMTHRGPSNPTAHVLGLEFVLLWWYANPDQMPVELTSTVHRLPPCTLRQQRRLAEAEGGGDSNAATKMASTQAVVEPHLREYIRTYCFTGSADRPTDWRRQVAFEDGGFLCPAAVFPPSYRDSLRAHLHHIHHRGDLVTCPLFLRVLEVAIAAASTDPHSWMATTSQATNATQTVAGRRGRTIAQQLVVEWLWPVVCATTAPPPPSSSSSSLRELTTWLTDSSAEKMEDWAVLVAVVTAVAQVRRHLLPLRRTNSGPNGTTVARIRDELYIPAMRALLCTTSSPSTGKEGCEDAELAVADVHLPSWTSLVFVQVATCFQECGWLRRSVAGQPATPARLWHRLFHTLCATFPNVFHTGNAVTALWTLWAMEEAAAVPATYHSTFQPSNKGRIEALEAWAGVLACKQILAGARCMHRGRTTAVVADENEEELTGDWFTTEDASLCPRAERRERAAYVAVVASGESLQTQLDDAALPPVVTPHGSTATHGGRRTPRLGRHVREALLFPSFASPSPSPPPPSHLTSKEARAQMQAYLVACRELNEEVRSVVIQIFRHYATLPIPRPTGSASAAGAATPTALRSSPSAEEVAWLHRNGQPSFFVLLKLLHSLAVLGDTFGAEGRSCSSGGGGSRRVPGLVPSVLRDATSTCHPVVAAYLRKMQVYSTTVSGRDGALALLFDDELQAQLNSLPLQLGRRRLVVALLWSGLPASTLTETNGEGDGDAQRDVVGAAAEVDETAFGSGSLAWRVLGSNQLHFFSSKPPAGVEPPVANTPTEVGGLVDEVVKHLWQLAVAVPEPARLLLHLHPTMYAYATTSSAEADHAVEPGEIATTASFDEADESSPAGALEADEHEGLDKMTTGTTSPTREWTDAAADGDGADDDFETPPNWSSDRPDALEEHADAAPSVMREASVADAMMESATGDAADATQWSARETLRPSAAATAVEKDATRPSGQMEEREGTEDAQRRSRLAEEAVQANARAVVAALHTALSSSQHLFFSLLEVLAWVANAQETRTPLPTAAEVNEEPQRTCVSRVGRSAWCAQLAAYYRRCAAVWAARAEVRHVEGEGSPQSTASTTAGIGAVLCRPKLLEQVILILSQTCPDVYLLSLLLLHLVRRGTDGSSTSNAGQASPTRQQQRAVHPFPWSVECALAQLLYHAGEDAARVRRWRTTTATDAETKPGIDSRDTFLEQVELHRTLLESLSDFQMSQCPPEQPNHCSADDEGVAASTTNAFLSNEAVNNSRPKPATQQDLVMSIGSLLLSSLQLRFHSTAGQRSFYRYNFYVNEFLLHTFPGPAATDATEITPLRVVLPSVQLKSVSPGAAPPQELLPLRQAWRNEVMNTQRSALRNGFRGKKQTKSSMTYFKKTPNDHNAGGGSGVATTREVGEVGGEDDYAKAFL